MNIAIVFAFVALFYVILPVVFTLFIKDKRKRDVAFTIYIMVFLVMLVCGTMAEVSFSNGVTINFKVSFIEKTFDFNSYDVGWQDFIINITMLAPLGIAVYMTSNKLKFFKVFLIGILTGFSIEMLQLILPISRCPQLSDILLNAFSALWGGLYISIIANMKEKHDRERAMREEEEEEYLRELEEQEKVLIMK